MIHPSPSGLVELHFGESPGHERPALEAHVRGCRACSGLLDEIAGLEEALRPDSFSAPPRDGLERVLTRVDARRRSRARRAEWALAAVPSALALGAGGWAVRAGAERLSALGLVPPFASGLVSPEVLAASLAALGLVVLGALVTLALAPVLILESRGRS